MSTKFLEPPFTQPSLEPEALGAALVTAEPAETPKSDASAASNSEDPFDGVPMGFLKDYVFLQKQYDNECTSNKKLFADYRMVADKDDDILRELIQIEARISEAKEQLADTRAASEQQAKEQREKVHSLRQRMADLTCGTRMADDENARLRSRTLIIERKLQREQTLLADARAALVRVQSNIPSSLHPLQRLLCATKWANTALDDGPAFAELPALSNTTDEEGEEDEVEENE
uniref:Uncharacterized protein n=1 Tax=Mycena chlorophos TaxID=658473 RepID=A0ABQ0L6P2_MYCCL|nr:predicted protein [Mycena chlorophos]